VIGEPVRHSLSPILHNAAFSALELDWVYVAFEVPPASLASALAGVRALGIDGLSVTMPHKAAVFAAVDRRSTVASRLGAVNTVVRRGEVLEGHSTDGDGFLASLGDMGVGVEGRRCLLLGTGGAARAVALALGNAGASSVTVVGRRPEMAAATASLARSAGRVGPVSEASDASIIINATPVGMDNVVAINRSHGSAGLSSADPVGALPLGLDPGTLGSGQVVVDLIYAPAVTPLLEAAKRRGAEAVNGLGMLIHQAALQFRLWTGEDAPLEAMSAAAVAAVAAMAHRR
jgi:shikimate dehydrogenase